MNDKIRSSTQEDIDKAWSEEVESRMKNLETGKAKLIPCEEVIEKVRESLKSEWE